jgi:hypothetical protein
MFNAGTEGVAFRLPPAPNGAPWRLAVDTCHDAPQDCCAAGEEPLLAQSQAYQVGARSSATLLARRTDSAHEGDSASTITLARDGAEHSEMSAPQTERKPA